MIGDVQWECLTLHFPAHATTVHMHANDPSWLGCGKVPLHQRTITDLSCVLRLMTHSQAAMHVVPLARKLSKCVQTRFVCAEEWRGRPQHTDASGSVLRMHRPILSPFRVQYIKVASRAQLHSGFHQRLQHNLTCGYCACTRGSHLDDYGVFCHHGWSASRMQRVSTSVQCYVQHTMR